MIEQLLNVIKTCWPVRIVLPDQKGVYVILGKWHWNKEPGFYFVIPAIMEVYIVNATEQVCDFPQMALTTKDRKGILLDGTISYIVTDPYKALFCVNNLDETLRARTMGALTDFVSRRDRSECIEQDDMQEVINEDLDELQEQFGFEIVKLDITTNINARGLYISR